MPLFVADLTQKRKNAKTFYERFIRFKIFSPRLCVKFFRSGTDQENRFLLG